MAQLMLPMAGNETDAYLSSLPPGDDVVGVEVLWLSCRCPAGVTKDDIASMAMSLGRFSEVYGVQYLTGVDRRRTLESLGFLEVYRGGGDE